MSGGHKDSKDDASTIEIEQLVQFFNEKGVSPDCPVCGHQKWTVLQDENHPNLALHVEGYDRDTISTYYPTIACICRNCGFYRLHMRPIFDEWLNEQRARQKELGLKEFTEKDDE